MKPVSFGGNAINDGTNYESIVEIASHGVAQISAELAQRSGSWPLVGTVERPGRRVDLTVWIRGASVDALRTQLFQYFDYESETPQVFVVEDTAGTNDRYVNAIPLGVFPDDLEPEICYHIPLIVHGDIRYRKTTADTDTWGITATGQTKVLSNGGDDDAYPILTITPTSNKTGGYAYRRFVALKWNSENGALFYPVDVIDSSIDLSALNGAGKLQADGDDLRLFINGIDYPRLIDPTLTNDYVWTMLTFQPTVTLELATAVNSSATTLELIDPNARVGAPLPARLPSSNGILLIGSEVITYTAKQAKQGTVTGCTRGAKDTSAASHSSGDTVYWIQYDITLLYGNSSAADPPTFNYNYEAYPILSLDESSNILWFYTLFWNQQPGTDYRWQWYFSGNSEYYGGYQGAKAAYGSAGIACVIGNQKANQPFTGQWSLYHPCVITDITLADTSRKYIGATNSSEGQSWNAELQSSEDGQNWTTELAIPQPTADDTWEFWDDASSGIDLTGEPRFVRLILEKGPGNYDAYLDADYGYIELDTTRTPTVTISAETGNYHLDAIITNNTTGEAFRITFDMAANEDLEIDSDAKKVTYLFDGRNVRSALVVDGTRREWLRLQPGNNTIQFDDTGTNGVTLGFEWEERHYQ